MFKQTQSTFCAYGIEQVCSVYGLVGLFWGPLDIFLEFYLFSECFTASRGKLATTVLILPGISSMSLELAQSALR